MANLKYISRHIDGYQLRLEPSMYFAFRQYGGIRKALDAAIEERRKRLIEAGELYALTAKVNRPKRTMKNSTTGIIGVELYFDPRYDDDGQWIAVGKTDTRYKRKGFACRKHGDRGAFHKACEVRYILTGALRLTLPLAELPYPLKFPYYKGEKIVGR